jgi:outer membrane protein assembly factor BamB
MGSFPDADPGLEEEVLELLSYTGDRNGLCLVLGIDNGQVAYEIASQSMFNVVAFDDSENNITKYRRFLQDRGVYGRKNAAFTVGNMSKLPVASELANLVWVKNASVVDADETIRLIAPYGKAVVKGANLKEWMAGSGLLWQVDVKELDNHVAILTKHPIETAGSWTHQYGQPDNSDFGGESLWGSASNDDFEVQWIGRPGPRFQTDRSGRKPSPLSASGRMFVQGNERVIALDAYNGSILWSKEVPGFLRMNIPRDCSNWAVDDTHLFLAVKSNLVRIDQANGMIERSIPVDDPGNPSYDWGYIGALNDRIIGSAIPSGSNYTNFEGLDGWYDAKSGPLAYKVISKKLFALSKDGSQTFWNHEPRGAIINPTIAVYRDQVCFVESRTRNLKLSKEGRGGDDLFNATYLVALDVNNGATMWEQKIEIEPGIAAFYLAAGNGKYVLVSSNNGKYHIYCFSASDGSMSWKTQQQWRSDSYGYHMSIPAIVHNRLMVKPALYRVDSGERLDFDVPRAGHGCASYALTEQSVIYRGLFLTMFNFDTRSFTKWPRLRPDCWLSAIPAMGMILSPEAGGGCSCGGWMETSMALAPRSRAPLTIHAIRASAQSDEDKNMGYVRINGLASFLVDYEFEEFVDSQLVDIAVKPGVTGEVHVTTDGSEPDTESPLYTQPVILRNDAVVKAAIFIEQNGVTKKYKRERSFTRSWPAPEIIPQREIVDGTRYAVIMRTGRTGTVRFTTDGSVPTRRSDLYESPLGSKDKVLIKARTFWKDDHGKLHQSETTSLEMDVPGLLQPVEVDVEPGIAYGYYQGDWSYLPDFDSISSLTAGVNNVLDLSPRKRDHKYGIRYTGYLKVPADGIYTIYMNSDDASKIYLHGNELVENDGSYLARELKGDIGLKTGLHPITVVYFQHTDAQLMKIDIEGPGISKTPIPQHFLFH